VQFDPQTTNTWPPGSQWNLTANLPREARPPDSLLRAHFVQALLHWVVHRPDEMRLTSWPVFASAFRGPLNDYFDVDLGHPRWTADAGKQVLEQYMMHRLYGCLPPLLRGPGEGAERKRRSSGADPLNYLIAKRRRAQRALGGNASPVSRRRKLNHAGRWSSSGGGETADSLAGSLHNSDGSSSSDATRPANASGAHLHVDTEMWPEKFYRPSWSPYYVPSPRPEPPSITQDADDETLRQLQASVWSEFGIDIIDPTVFMSGR
jgi:hypothetical protein